MSWAEAQYVVDSILSDKTGGEDVQVPTPIKKSDGTLPFCCRLNRGNGNYNVPTTTVNMNNYISDKTVLDALGNEFFMVGDFSGVMHCRFNGSFTDHSTSTGDPKFNYDKNTHILTITNSRSYTWQPDSVGGDIDPYNFMFYYTGYNKKTGKPMVPFEDLPGHKTV